MNFTEAFPVFRTVAFTFATLMLVKYFLFLLIAPFYTVKEARRKIRLEKLRLREGRPVARPKVSVIVPAWNEEVGIIRTVESIVASRYRNIEVIIVNDGSTDNMDKLIRKYLRSHPAQARYIRYISKKNGGKGTALNVGIRHSSGEIIFTIDADSAMHPDAITNVVHYFEDPKIWAVVGNVQVARNRTLIGFLQQLEYLFGFYFKRAHAVLGAEYIFGGANTAYRRGLFKELGLFDISNKTEDIEMSLRTRFFGKDCAYGEDVVVYTEGASTMSSLVNQRLRWKKGRFDTFIKYRAFFFSRQPHHNKWLAFFVLPFSVLAELQLVFEPIALSILVTYSFVTGDFVSLALGSLFVLAIYIVNALFSHAGMRLRYLVLFPFTWPLFYILVWVEYVALMRGTRMVIRGEDIEWQRWERTGIEEA